MHEENKLASNGCKFAWEESVYSLDDEVRYVFTPIEQNYNSNLKNILLWTSSGEKDRAWANKATSVGLFEIKWKTP